MRGKGARENRCLSLGKFPLFPLLLTVASEKEMTFFIRQNLLTILCSDSFPGLNRPPHIRLPLSGVLPLMSPREGALKMCCARFTCAWSHCRRTPCSRDWHGDETLRCWAASVRGSTGTPAGRCCWSTRRRPTPLSAGAACTGNRARRRTWHRPWRSWVREVQWALRHLCGDR